MNQNIHWPDKTFSLQNAIEANRGIPEAEIRKELAKALAAKVLIQTLKGNHRVKGQFRLVVPKSEVPK